MNIILNGKPTKSQPNSSITDLLTELGFAEKPVVVELNKSALFPRDYPATILSDGDCVEIILIAAGG